MKKTVILLLSLVLFISALPAEVSFRETDYMYWHETGAQEIRDRLLSDLEKAENDEERAEVLWRLSRITITLGDTLDSKDKEGRLDMFSQGLSYAEQSIDLHPSFEAYLWKCSNLGRWGQTKGIFESLAKAEPMHEDLLTIVDGFGVTDSAEAWYILATLFDQLPGSPISFGNKNYAISYLRAGIDSIDKNLTAYPGHYHDLAEMLYRRNWNAKKRAKELQKMEKEWNSHDLNSEKYRYYEGKGGKDFKPFYSNVELGKMSDRQEAVMLLQYAKALIDVWPYSTGQYRYYEKKIDALLDKWL